MPRNVFNDLEDGKCAPFETFQDATVLCMYIKHLVFLFKYLILMQFHYRGICNQEQMVHDRTALQEFLSVIQKIIYRACCSHDLYMVKFTVPTCKLNLSSRYTYASAKTSNLHWVYETGLCYAMFCGTRYS